MHVILDGKTLRGTQHHLAEDQRKMHHVSLYEATTGVVLKEHMVAEKEGEVTQQDVFLTPLLQQGRIISADALYTHRHFCHQVVTSGGQYLLFVKGINPRYRKIYASSYMCPFLLISVMLHLWPSQGPITTVRNVRTLLRLCVHVSMSPNVYPARDDQ